MKGASSAMFWQLITMVGGLHCPKYKGAGWASLKATIEANEITDSNSIITRPTLQDEITERELFNGWDFTSNSNADGKSSRCGLGWNEEDVPHECTLVLTSNL